MNPRAHLMHALATQLRENSARPVCLIFFAAGAIAFACSIYYSSSILAFIGLGLVFWAAILLYIRPAKYVTETLLDKTTLSSLVGFEQIVTELGYKGIRIYLPPKYFKNFESSKVYVTAREDTKLPSPEQIQEEDRIFLKNPEAMLITPSGAELTKLFEEALGTSFTKVDLHYIEQNLPKLLTEDLEIAQSFEIEKENKRICVKIENSIYRNLRNEIRKKPDMQDFRGCPLSSAIAIALAKATGNPVIIERDQTSNNNQTSEIEYRLLDEPEEKTE